MALVSKIGPAYASCVRKILVQYTIFVIQLCFAYESTGGDNVNDI